MCAGHVRGRVGPPLHDPGYAQGVSPADAHEVLGVHAFQEERGCHEDEGDDFLQHGFAHSATTRRCDHPSDHPTVTKPTCEAATPPYMFVAPLVAVSSTTTKPGLDDPVP